MADELPPITDKQAVIDVLSRLPDDVSLEDIRYEFDLIHSLLEGMAAAEAGQTVPHAEVEEDLRRWQQKSRGQSLPAGS